MSDASRDGKPSEEPTSPEEFSLLRQLVCSVIPPLAEDNHKGTLGRVGIIGGSREYTGAPYFAAISALKVGADLSYVFCTKDAAPVIKSYSPELIVYPILDQPNGLEDIINFLPRIHSLVIGPGLGRDDSLLATVGAVINKVRELDIPMVLDADALHFVSQCPEIIRGYKKAILTPNPHEFDRLYNAVHQGEPSESQKDGNDNEMMLKDLCKTLGGITIVRKGKTDLVSDGETITSTQEPGSLRRCGGQGDLMAGALAAFAYWSNQAFKRSDLATHGYGANVIACVGASMITRRCSRLAFAKAGRSMTATDMIKQIRQSFVELFPVD